MHFIINTNIFTLTANFTPCLVWKTCDAAEGIPHTWNPHRDNPHYQKGDLLEAIRYFQLDTNKVLTVQLVIMPDKQSANANDAKQLRSDISSIFDSFELINLHENS